MRESQALGEGRQYAAIFVHTWVREASCSIVKPLKSLFETFEGFEELDAEFTEKCPPQSAEECCEPLRP